MEGVKKPGEATDHQLTLTNRSLLAVDGVTNLESYEAEQIVLETHGGVLEIKGEKLHIQQLHLEQGRVLLDGVVGSLNYLDRQKMRGGRGLWHRLVK